MKKQTLDYRFKKLKSKDIGDIVTLASATAGMKYGKQKIFDAFNKFVSKDQYDAEEKDELLEWLIFHNETGTPKNIL